MAIYPLRFNSSYRKRRFATCDCWPRHFGR